MFDFRTPQLTDKPEADKIFHNLSYRCSEFCFGNLFLWGNYYKIKIAFSDGFLIIKTNIKDRPYFLFPAGNGNLKEIIEKIIDDCKKNGHELIFNGVTPEMAAKLEMLFPGEFEFTPVRANFDYIYNSSDLINLAGKKYHSKRNFITRFNNSGNLIFEEIDDNNSKECLKLYEEWCKINDCGQNRSLGAESYVIKEAFANYKELGFSGGLIRQNGKLVAFSIGEKLCDDTFVVHIEKAFYDVPGAYPVINKEFSTHFCENYTYINREDDVGAEGLRKSKLSYYPAILLEKNDAVYKKLTFEKG